MSETALHNTDPVEDLGLIKAIQQRDRDAFAQLYDRYSSWLMAIARRILENNRDAEDLLHDVFLEIWHKADSFDPQRGSLKSWLAVKVRSRAIDRLRVLNKLKHRHVDEQDTSISFETTAEERYNLEHDHRRAKQTMQQLSPLQRNVIELSYYHGLTCQEIANNYDIPLGTVKSGMQRGIKILRQKLNCRVEPDVCQ